MSETSRQRAEAFLNISSQFKLGALTTESSHPVTANLSDTARRDISAGLKLLFDVDDDVIRKYREFAESGRARQISDTLLAALRNGGRIFFTGCGSTGRLSIQLVSIWRDFWQQVGRGTPCAPGTENAGGGVHGVSRPTAEDWENRAFPVMAGGDFALIKAVEGFEDFTAFGKKQIGDLGVCEKDVVFAITEGGETSFVIGTAWKGVEVGAKAYFVYNNPDDVLCAHVQRSREVIEEPRIEKINLTTGPMAITGSTRMQATSIQLAVLVTVLEMVVRELVLDCGGKRSATPLSNGASAPQSGVAAALCHRSPNEAPALPGQFLAALTELHATLISPAVLAQLAKLVAMEETVYRDGRKNNYFADRVGIDMLTDTTERSPTYCTPPFRKFDDTTATESWAFLYVPYPDSPTAWERVCKRTPRCVEWRPEEVRGLVPDDKYARTVEIIGKISYAELMRFRIGLDGVKNRPLGAGDSAVALVIEAEMDSLLAADGFFHAQLEVARRAGAKTGLIFLGSAAACREVGGFMAQWNPDCVAVLVPMPKGSDGTSVFSLSSPKGGEGGGEEALGLQTQIPSPQPSPRPSGERELLLNGAMRVGLKMLLNALSTCTMVRLGRVMGNFMIWVVPSNLKLIDRATRYIQKLTGLDYEAANHLLFEVIEYVEPRMKSDQAYPPVVGMAVIRQRHGLSNEEAEKRLKAETG